MGSLHGGPIGMVAGVIACIGYSFNWFEDGRDDIPAFIQQR